jgi:hypothetical protein
MVIKNILEELEYKEPDYSLLPPEGMCRDCENKDVYDWCEKCKEERV